MSQEEAPFSVRELRGLFESQTKAFNHLEASIEKKFEERVKPLEEELAKMMLWREGIMGKISVIILVLGSVWTVAVAYFSKKI